MTVSLTKTFTAESPVGQALSRVQYLDALIADAQAERKTLTDALADYGTGRHVVEGVGTFTVSESNTYPKEAIESMLSPGQVKRVSKAVIDGAVVKRLYPDVYAAVKRTNGFKVAVSR